MRNKFVFAVLLNILFISHLTAQSADSILEKYFQASGFSNLGKVTTIIYSGKITGGNLKNNSVDYLMKKVRPSKFVMELKNKGVISQTIFDGRSEWVVTGGKTTKNLFDVEEPRKRKMCFEGELFYCKNNNYNIEYGGLVNVEGLDFQLIKVSNKDGFKAEYYLDPGSCMLMKSVEGGSATYYGDFRTIEGVVFPFSIRVIQIAGNIATDMKLDSIEFNKEVDTNIFVK